MNEKKIKLEPAIIWKLVTCQRITSKNTWPRWVDTWARDTVKWYWSAGTLFWQLSIDQNIDVQYVCIISLTSKSMRLNIVRDLVKQLTGQRTASK